MHQIKLVPVENDHPTALNAINAYVPVLAMLATGSDSCKVVEAFTKCGKVIWSHLNLALSQNLETIPAVPSLQQTEAEPVGVNPPINVACFLFPHAGMSDEEIRGC
mmetsp:Transcript_69793/g.105475  ORF Transcript_69793/g.105475 Transcript_69793/m.105475 type:complete len:106 (-) Transcript_69793:566-883(-)